MGFRRPLEVSQAVRRWLAGEYRSLKGEFARSHLAELVPDHELFHGRKRRGVHHVLDVQPVAGICRNPAGGRVRVGE